MPVTYSLDADSAAAFATAMNEQSPGSTTQATLQTHFASITHDQLLDLQLLADWVKTKN